jgi:hypothetical protein
MAAAISIVGAPSARPPAVWLGFELSEPRTIDPQDFDMPIDLTVTVAGVASVGFWLTLAVYLAAQRVSWVDQSLRS